MLNNSQEILQKIPKSYKIQCKQQGTWNDTGYCFLEYDTAIDFLLDLVEKHSTQVYRISKVY